MASIIKNQIIKHLSKFVRNITADQISVQILSGKGELKNIELNEIVLTEVLELPTWLRVKRAICNRIAVKVPWTKLKSQPVKLFIDEVRIEVELGAEVVVSCDSNPLSNLGDSAYGFANRVAELMSIYVNSVEISFDSGVFRGSLTLSRLAVESKSPGWQTVSDLRYTRFVDATTGRLLLFKMVTWQLLRIETSAQSNSSRNATNAPLRLITSNGKSRFSVKKSTVDGSVLGGRIQVILDDILWIATLPQVRSAITFYDHIMKIVKAASSKVSNSHHIQHIGIKLPVVKSLASVPASDIFRNFDFDRTSYHIYVGKIVLHLCDDNQTLDGYPEDWNIICGALQVTLLRLSVDIYPASRAFSDRSDWIRYDNANHCAAWIHRVLQLHLRKLCVEMDSNGQSQVIDMWPQLLSQNCVIRMYDIIVQCVTDTNSKKEALFNLFMSDRKLNTGARDDSPLFHLELTSFYHPSSEDFPVPSNTTHLLLGPFFFVVDQKTIRWLLFIMDDIRYALQISSAMLEVPKIPKTHLRINLLMPKIIIPLQDPFISDIRFARKIVISMNTLLATNCEAVSDDGSNPFFKSISPNIIDFIDCIELLVNKEELKDFIFQLNQKSCEDVDQAERIWINSSPVRINADFVEEALSVPLLADVAFHAFVGIKPRKVSVAVQPMSRIRVAVNHLQFLQIMRLTSHISSFVDQLITDQKFFCANRGSGNGTAVEIIWFLNEAEINIILPNQPVLTPYDLQETLLQSPTSSFDDRNEILRPSCLTPTDCAPEQETTDAKTPTAFRDDQEGSGIFDAEFPQQMDSESVGAEDETLSLATDISEEKQHLMLFDVEDDIFSEEIVTAEEAFAEDASLKPKQIHEKLKQQVNILSALLIDMNVVVSSLNNASQGAGYITKVTVQQSFNKELDDFYATINSQESHNFTGNISVNSDKATINFQFHSLPDGRPPSIKLQIDGFRAALDDIIMMHLSAFIYDDQKTGIPLNLKINLVDTQIFLKDSKTKPFLIKLNDCVIEQTEEDDANFDSS